MPDNNNLLSISNLSASIGRQVVLSDISIDVNEAECVAIVGGSGSGKSSLLHCLIGLYKPVQPFAGRMQFGDEQYDFSAAGVVPRDRSRISFVPQNPQAGLDPLKRLALQWRQTLRCGGGSEMPNSEQQALLNSLGLQHFGRSFPHQWSQGMQQRLLIAFALLAKPQLLVLDEPTSALDPLIAAKTITTVMEHARQRNIAVLIVTHDLALASRFAQRVAIMATGRILEFGPSQQLLDKPHSKYGQLLVSNRSWSGHRSVRQVASSC
ncbi:ATP-binding cassette domain-containing protein [Motiliproteus sp. MSK22-1]|uniref:ATP-binding cassette domain-containing protein n=1 Tax=Motiliproteus sp. MSK22-1 TaxID=1897630 RepID=UPI000975EDB4|nr:ATP-binding cassette domain-containing protein [Motiliproteus sp. MSK22-1]OMH33566.1 hypothetical protein BGP75_11080 [Motiliproteus sp. MSK22-1]